MLNAAGVDFEDKNMDFASWPTTKVQLNEKSQFKFANLPYLIDGDLILFESMAIVKYVARKCNFIATQEPAAVSQDICDSVITDIYGKIYGARFQEPIDSRIPALEKIAKDMSQLSGLDLILSKNKYLAGYKLTYVDFMLLALGDMLCLWDSDVFEKCENIKRHKKTMLEHPKIAEYYLRCKGQNNMLGWDNSLDGKEKP